MQKRKYIFSILLLHIYMPIHKNTNGNTQAHKIQNCSEIFGVSILKNKFLNFNFWKWWSGLYWTNSPSGNNYKLWINTKFSYLKVLGKTTKFR